MTITELRAQCDEQPFHPFILHLADGRQIPVNHPDYVAYAPNGRSVIVYQLNNSYNVVDLRLVTDLEVSPNGESPQPTS